MFVIQSMPRCGTHLVRTALDSHRNIDCFGEVFNPEAHQHGFEIDQPSPGELIDYCRQQKRVTGFVAHAYVGLAQRETGAGLDAAYRAQPDVQSAKGLWRAIPRDVPVVTLWRRNLLARHVSKLVASRRSVWATHQGQPLPSPLKVRVNCASMLVDFARTVSLMELARRRFPSALRVCYEQLAEHTNQTLQEIQSHLDVEPEHLSPRTIKTGRPLEETVLNLDEVRVTLRDTPYAAFLRMPT